MSVIFSRYNQNKGSSFIQFALECNRDTHDWKQTHHQVPASYKNNQNTWKYQREIDSNRQLFTKANKDMPGQCRGMLSE